MQEMTQNKITIGNYHSDRDRKATSNKKGSFNKLFMFNVKED